MLLAFSLTMTFAACAHRPGEPAPGAAAVPARSLPADRDVVLDPVPEPNIRASDDARLALAKSENARRENANRLISSRANYRRVRQMYGAK